MESERRTEELYQLSNKLRNLVRGSNIQKMIMSLIYLYIILSLIKIGP